jgi:hypothetical protein
VKKLEIYHIERRIIWPRRYDWSRRNASVGEIARDGMSLAIPARGPSLVALNGRMNLLARIEIQ